MKITKEGQLPETRKPDFAGKTLTCSNCRAEITLDETDTLNVEKRPNGKRWFNCPKPGCGTQIVVPNYRFQTPPQAWARGDDKDGDGYPEGALT